MPAGPAARAGPATGPGGRPAPTPGAALAALQARIVACRRCPRLVRYRAAVAQAPPARFRTERYWARPVPSLGGVSARLLLVGLAPAAHGGNRTGRMFTGDAPGGSGEWVARALHAHGFATQPTSRHRGDGFRLRDAYITAALHCVPPANRPQPEELRRCGDYLRAELALLRRVRVIVALGRIAFDACLDAALALGWGGLHPRPRFRHGVVYRLRPPGREPVTLLASYHPSRQNTQTGRLRWAMFARVFARARDALEPVGPPQALARSRRQRRGSARPPGRNRPTRISMAP